MIEVAIVLAVAGWVSALSKESLMVRSSSYLNPYDPSVWDGTPAEAFPDDPLATKEDGGGAPSTIPFSGMKGGTVCGDGVTDYSVMKTVVFRASTGTAVRGLKLNIGICDEPNTTSLQLSDVPSAHISNGTLTSPHSWSRTLYSGNYTLTIENHNGTDMANDGNLGDNQIEILIDGFAIGELPMTMANDSETYNLIVNPD